MIKKQDEINYMNNVKKLITRGVNIKKKDIDEINNWDTQPSKNKYNVFHKSTNKNKIAKITKKNENKKIIDIDIFKKLKIFQKLNESHKNKFQYKNLMNLVKNINYNNKIFLLYKKIINYNLHINKHFLLLNKKNEIINKTIYILLDCRLLKTKIIIFNNKKCLFSLTNGIVFKNWTLKIKSIKNQKKFLIS